MADVMADGGGSPRCGALMLGGSVGGSSGREPAWSMDGGKAALVEGGGGCGGEYAWGLGYPFGKGGLSVSNMCASWESFDGGAQARGEGERRERNSWRTV